MYDIREIKEAYFIDEACKLLAEDPGLKVIAGGTDLLVKLREGSIESPKLLSIHLIDDLKKITIDDDGDIEIGALATFTEIAENPIIKENLPELAEAVLTAGGPQLRNAATIGGNVCNAAPSADSAPMLFCLEALVNIVSAEGNRQVPITEFYLGLGKVDLKDKEFVKSFTLRKENYENYIGKYFKYAMRNAMDIATSSCATLVKLDDDLKIEKIRACYGVASVIPVRAYKTEEEFVGKVLTEENIKAFAKLALEELSPRDSWRASKALRTQILYEICVRNLEATLSIYKGENDEN